uniref:DNA repair endonuclease XPF n=1 Tax=Anopheles farauti TaxID=69004 RepID=A0A182QSS3_9DIPT
MSFETDEDLDLELASSAEQAEQKAKAVEEAAEEKALTEQVDAEEFLASEGVPLLEYEKQMFFDLLHTDALVVCAKGISYERAMLNLLKIFCDNSTLVLVVNCSESEERYYRMNLEHSEHIHDSAKTAAERERTYLQGGIQFITTRILVVDLLKNRIPIELITGMFVVRAHEIVESCQEAFALRLYRQRNKVGFVKAFSRNVEAFTYGYGHVEKVMRNLFVKELFIWPRFHMTIQRSLRPYEPGVVEIQIPMTHNMILLQTNLLDLMNYLVKSIKNLNRFVELQEVTVENCVTKKFHKILQAQLDTIWHQLSSQTKLIVADLKVLRSLMISCLYGDSVSFYALLKRYRTTEYALNNSGWTIMEAAEKVFTIAKERVFNKENEFEPELCPKWKALSDVLRVDIPNDVKQTAAKIRNKEQRQKYLQQQVKILILCQDSRACYQLNQFLTQGPERYLFYQALKNDVSVAKLSEQFQHFNTEQDGGAFKIQEFEPVSHAPKPSTSAAPSSSRPAEKEAPVKGGFLRERIAKKRKETAEQIAAQKRKEIEQQDEDHMEGDELEESGAKKSDMEKDLAAVRTEEQEHHQYFRDSYVLTMSQRPLGETDPSLSQPEFDASMMSSCAFESFAEMENMDITGVVKDTNRPLVFIQTFKSESNGLGALDRALEQIKPRYIVMYHANVTAIRQIEVYEARQQRQEIARVRVFAIIHSKTVEEQSYLTSLRREKQAFELLIETKRTMVVPEYQDGKSEDTIMMLQKKQEISSRQAGGQDVKDPSEIVTPRVIVDMREFRSDLPCLIHRRGIDVVPLTITIGDYIITPEICVERKSISDLIGSLNSGRLYNQCVQMTRYYAKPILLIEFDQNKPFHFQRYFMVSNAGGSSSGTGTGSSNEDIMAKLQLLTIHFPKLRLVWSPSPYSTAQLFEELKQGKAEPDPDVAVKVGSDETPNDDHGDTVDALANVEVQEFLLKLPGITTRNVGRIMRQCRSLRELTQKTEAQLEELVGGPAGAKQLWDILHNVHKPAQADPSEKPYGGKFKRGGKRF